MATVKIKQIRDQNAQYGLYRTGVGGDEPIIIRRKIGEPTDYEHKKSRTLQQQRQRLGVASKHWHSLTASQKALWRRTLGYGYRSASPQQETLLKGRQLFISQELYSLFATGIQLQIPYQLCILLCDAQHTPLSGELWLFYYEPYKYFEAPPGYEQLIFEPWADSLIPFEGGLHLCPGEEIAPGNWLFTSVPRGKKNYRVEGRVHGYYDPKLPEHQFMTEEYLKSYHFHVLHTGLTLVILEPWTTGIPGWEYTRIILEPWHEGEIPPYDYTPIYFEQWSVEDIEFPTPPPWYPYQLLVFELWTS